MKSISSEMARIRRTQSLWQMVEGPTELYRWVRQGLTPRIAELGQADLD